MFDMLDEMGGAVTEAFDGVQEAFGQETDPQLKVYNGLTNQHFDAMRLKFGESELGRYIKTMESKRLGVK